MPIYSYKCSNNHTFDKYWKISEITDIVNPLKVYCPECGLQGERDYTKSTIGLKFKGSGFYETDYKGK